VSEKRIIEGIEQAIPLDLSAETLARLELDPTNDDVLSPYIFNGRIRYGGYGEKRSLYSRSDHFSGEEPRNIHLGLDIWTAALTPVYCQWDGVLIGQYDNNCQGDYGPTLILSHEIDGKHIHALYGHLSRSSLSRWTVGERIPAGTELALLGAASENGGWLPHLHFQLIKDLEGSTTDYPGVCRFSEWEKYQLNCPDPKPILFKK